MVAALSLSKSSPEFLIDQNRFLPDLSYTFSQYLITCFNSSKIGVRHAFNNLESSVVKQELELAISFALYGVYEVKVTCTT